MSNTAFSWISYYTELADKLIPYRNNRPKLIDQITRAFTDASLEMPSLDNGAPTDIDPFTVFGLFNKMKLKDDKRRAILGSIGVRLGVTAPMPDDFDGVPVLSKVGNDFHLLSRNLDIDGARGIFRYIVFAKKNGSVPSLG